MKKLIKVRPELHAIGFDLCCNGKFSRRQAMIMANGFKKRGLIEAMEGCLHYVLRLTCKGKEATAANE